MFRLGLQRPKLRQDGNVAGTRLMTAEDVSDIFNMFRSVDSLFLGTQSKRVLCFVLKVHCKEAVILRPCLESNHNTGEKTAS